MLTSIGRNGLDRDRRSIRIVGGHSSDRGNNRRRINRLASEFANLLDERSFVRVAPSKFGGKAVEHFVDLVHAVSANTEREPHSVDVSCLKATVVRQVRRFSIRFIGA
jgi:spore cortex formation protein SpoVR/YcgB (stage V sporulation)